MTTLVSATRRFVEDKVRNELLLLLGRNEHFFAVILHAAFPPMKEVTTIA